MPRLVEAPLVEKNVVEEGFVNSFACNIYHDGTEGLGQHFDDELRFKHPVTSLRLFSDSRLSFGCKLFACCNGEFFVAMPRGSITIMEDKGYAVNHVKHCIKPCDMTGRSGVILMRQIQPQLVKTAQSHCLQDLIQCFSTLGLEPKDVDAAVCLNPLDMLLALKSRPLDKLRFKTCLSLVNQIIRKIEKNCADASVMTKSDGHSAETGKPDSGPTAFDLFCRSQLSAGATQVLHEVKVVDH